jgi:hypothetical protein
LFIRTGDYLEEHFIASSPHVERVTVLGPETGTEKMAKRKKSLAVPLKTPVFGREPIIIGTSIERLHYTVLRGQSAGLGTPQKLWSGGPGTRYGTSGLQIKHLVRLAKPETGWYRG